MANFCQPRPLLAYSTSGSTAATALAGQIAPTQRDELRLFSSYCWLLLLGIGWLVLVIAGAEYHRKRVGRPGSWKLFALTLAAEGAILLATLLA